MEVYQIFFIAGLIVCEDPFTFDNEPDADVAMPPIGPFLQTEGVNGIFGLSPHPSGTDIFGLKVPFEYVTGGSVTTRQLEFVSPAYIWPAQTVTYTINSSSPYQAWVSFSSVAPVPVPAAVWLFGTALIGLVGSGKRKSRIAA